MIYKLQFMALHASKRQHIVTWKLHTWGRGW